MRNNSSSRIFKRTLVKRDIAEPPVNQDQLVRKLPHNHLTKLPKTRNTSWGTCPRSGLPSACLGRNLLLRKLRNEPESLTRTPSTRFQQSKLLFEGKPLESGRIRRYLGLLKMFYYRKRPQYLQFQFLVLLVYLLLLRALQHTSLQFYYVKEQTPLLLRLYSIQITKERYLIICLL